VVLLFFGGFVMGKKIVLFVVVLLFAVTAQAANIWFSGAGADALYTTPNNWWPFDDDGNPATPDIIRAPIDGDYVGHDAGGKTMLIQFPMMLNPARLLVGHWGPGPKGAAYMLMTGGIVNITGDFGIGIQPYADWGNPEWANYGNGIVTIQGGLVIAGGNLIVGEQGMGILNIEGGSVQAQTLLMGTVDPAIALNGYTSHDNLLNITEGKLILAGNISSLDPRVVAYGGIGTLVFDYEADVTGYTTIIALVPEPATLIVIGLGGLLIRRKRS
jgi:hypothetical protein